MLQTLSISAPALVHSYSSLKHSMRAEHAHCRKPLPNWQVTEQKAAANKLNFAHKFCGPNLLEQEQNIGKWDHK